MRSKKPGFAGSRCWPRASVAFRFAHKTDIVGRLASEVPSKSRWATCKAGAIPEDGALFAFVEGTDPEVFLFLEVRPGAGGPEWHDALASVGSWAMKVKRKDRHVWELPRRATGDPSKPLYTSQFRP